MKKDIIRAWKDPNYRRSLSEADRGALPAHPAGWPELEDEVMKSISGGCGPNLTQKGGSVCTPCPPEECY